MGGLGQRPRTTLGGNPRPAILRDAVAIAIGVGVYAVTFGVLAGAAGATLLQTVALSVLTFTGASQIALVGVLAAGGTPAAALGSALLLAARNGAYALTLSGRLRGSRRRRLAAAHLVIDESTAMAVSQSEPNDADTAFWATGMAIFVMWNAGTVVGALFGAVIGDLERLGLDVAFPAAFLALLAPLLRRPEGRVAAAAGGAVALMALPVTPAGAPILLAVIGAVPAFVIARRTP